MRTLDAGRLFRAGRARALGWIGEGTAQLDRARRPAPRVLLVAHNAMMASHLDAARKTIGDPGVEYAFTHPWIFIDEDEGRALADSLGLTYVPFSRALLAWWDLVLFADHHAAHFFPRAVPKVLVGHSATASKRDGATPYLFAPRRLLYRDGTPIYHAVLVATPSLARLAVRCCPGIRGRVRVAGNLDLDRLVAHDRQACRAALGIPPDTRAVLLLSTWGPDSLIATGAELLDAALVLQAEDGDDGWTEDVRFLLAAHPQAWESHRAELDALARRGLTVLPEGSDWTVPMAAADALVSDHTSLSVAAAVRGVASAFIALPSRALLDDDPVGRLYATRPRIETRASLAPTVRALLDRPALDASIAAEYLPRLGQAATAMRAVLEPHLRKPPCMLCAGRRHAVLFDEEFRVLLCLACGLVALDGPPRDLHRYYSGYSSAALTPAQHLRKQREAAAIMRWLRPRLRGRRVLELGCARGHLLAALAAEGYAVSGLDPDENAVREARALHGLDSVRQGMLGPPPAEEAGRYDAVVLVQTLEHIERPIEALEHARAYLDRRGALFVEVPDFYSPRGLYRYHHDGVDYPSRNHLYVYTQRTLGAVLARAGFALAGVTRTFDNLRVVARPHDSPPPVPCERPTRMLALHAALPAVHAMMRRAGISVTLPRTRPAEPQPSNHDGD